MCGVVDRVLCGVGAIGGVVTSALSCRVLHDVCTVVPIYVEGGCVLS